MSETDFEAVSSLLASGRRFLLTGHRNPDGDSLGSALALAQALAARGKDARVVMRDRWSSSYDGMPGVGQVVVSETLPSDWPTGWDAAIVMECPEAARPGFANTVAPVAISTSTRSSGESSSLQTADGVIKIVSPSRTDTFPS